MRSILVLITLSLGGCRTELLPAFERDGSASFDASGPPTDMSCRPDPRDKVDILFMIDDSYGMAPKLMALQTRFPDLIKVLDDFASMGQKASYHIGVITSDLGVPPTSGITCGNNRGAKLQPLGAAALPGCQGPEGNFLIYDQKDPANNNFDGDLPTTFSCMASVGDKGCGFEQPLEAVYRALHDPIPENAGFLRDDALLVVILVTDEDDCSVDPTSHLFDPSKTAYGPLQSFRCTRFGIFCDGALVSASPQAYTSCTPATPAQGGKLTNLDKYINFFTRPKSMGGVKDDFRDVILATIDAPSTPFSTMTSTDPLVCGFGVSSCTVLTHSCVDSTNSAFYGDPAVRINTLIGAVPYHAQSSICDTDYKSALDALGQRINAGRGCPP